jgi:outer membrane receptor protein involved in Fe transport
MKQILILVWLGLCSITASAQSLASAKGKVIDASTGQPIEYADVIVTGADQKVIASAFVNDGTFVIEQVPNGSYPLSVVLIGYQSYVSNPILFEKGKCVDLGTISLKVDETILQQVDVTAEKNRVVYKLDRQRINASASLVAAGGTAVDVLKSTPSIRVDADGNVTFRGSSGFLVYVDGKQSPLEGAQALQQVAASNIEDIEIITTPSARYRTEGDVGIINIITKRRDDAGVSGAVNLAGSTIGAWNADALVSHRKGANRFYVGAAFSENKGKSDFNQRKTTIVDDYVTTSDADGTRHSNVVSYIGRIGWEYTKNGHNLLVEAQGGVTKNKRGGDMQYYEHRMKGDELLIDNLFNSRDRYCNEKQLGQIAFEYTWKVNERGDKLSLANRTRYDWYALEYTESNMFDKSGKRYEGTRGYEDEHHWDADASANYQMNYRPGGKAEFGYQYTSYVEHGDYSITYWDREAQKFDWQDDLYAPFYYRRQIHSAYAMLTDKFGPLSVDAGVRADRTIDKLEIEVEGANRYIKYLEFFPSAHLSYEAPGKQHFSLGYSYRINRPGIWQLEPYITYEDYYTKMIGNPDIKPEYIHSLELGYRKTFAEKHTFAMTGYYRQRSGVRDRVRVAYEPGVTLDSLINAGKDRTFGLEVSANVKATRWWNMILNGSIYDYDFTSSYVGCSDASNTGYAVSMINNFTLGPTTRMQFDGNVVGPTVLTQGREDAYCYFDFAVRQQLMKNKLSVSLVAHDVFRTAKYNNYRQSQNLLSTTRVRPKYPNLMLSVSYTFNAKPKEHSGAVSTGAKFDGKDF